MQLIPNISKWLARCLTRTGWHGGTREEANAAPVAVLTLPDGRKLKAEELTGLAGTVNFRDGKLLGVTGKVQYEIIGTHSVGG